MGGTWRDGAGVRSPCLACKGEEVRRDGDVLGLLPNEAGCSPRGKLWTLSHSGASVCAGVEGVVKVRAVRTVRTNRPGPTAATTVIDQVVQINC